MIWQIQFYFMLIIFLCPVLILSIWLKIKLNWFKKILFSNFWKTWSNFHLCGRVPIKLVLFVSLLVCLSVHLWHIFIRIYYVDFLNFLHDDILPYIRKGGRARFRKIVFVVQIIGQDKFGPKMQYLAFQWGEHYFLYLK